MSFIVLKKKRYKFQVDLCLEELSEVSYSRGVMFAKVRQLDGGAFADVSKRMDIKDHRVKYAARFLFPCKMYAPVSTGVLEACKCRISIRMEEKGGRNFRKLGFVDVNLAEYAAVGPSTQRYILQPYDQHHRLDNSIVQVSINVTLREGDPVFQRPLTRQQPITLPGEESFRKNTAAAAAIANSNAANTQNIPSSIDPVAATANDSGGLIATDLVSNPLRLVSDDDGGGGIGGGRSGIPCSRSVAAAVSDVDLSHTRNSSSTSQTSAGYASQQSFGPVAVPAPPTTTTTMLAAAGAVAASPSASALPQPASTSTPSPASTSMANPAQHSQGLVASGAAAAAAAGHSRQSSSGESSSHGRNLSQGSSDTGIGYGSMEKEKRRKAKLDEGRVDAELVINELMEGIELDKHNFEEDGESSGLQLYVAKDGTVTFDKGSSRDRELKPVVVTGDSSR